MFPEQHDWVNTGEAAKRIGCSSSTVKTYIEKGWLVGRKWPNGRWRVTRESLDIFTSIEGPINVRNRQLLD